MDANDGAVEGELDFELPLVAVEESGNADQKGEDTNALGKPIRGHEGFPWSGKKKRRVYSAFIRLTARDRVHLANIMRKIRVMPDVIKVTRNRN
jgi:hypothetical protein